MASGEVGDDYGKVHPEALKLLRVLAIADPAISPQVPPPLQRLPPSTFADRHHLICVVWRV